MRRLIITCLVLLSTAFLFSENVLDRGLGFTAGKVSGIGIAYRQFFQKNGFQFTLGLLSDADEVPKFPVTYYNEYNTKTGWEVDGWISGMYLRVLRQSEFTRFYCFLGASMNIDYKKKYTQEYVSGQISGSPVKKTKNDNAYYFGPGIGIEFKLSRFISFNAELPVSVSSNYKIDTYIPQAGIIVKF